MKNIQRDLFQTSTAVPTRAISNVNTSDISGLVTRLSRRRPPRSIPPRHRVHTSTPGAIQPKSPNSPAPQNGKKSDAQTITIPGNQPGPTPLLAPKTNAGNSEIVKLTLGPEQSEIIGAILDRHRDKTKITGVLCALTRSFRPSAGCTTLEMQVLEVNQRTIDALRKITGR